jgi:hypothetical protein
MILDHRSQTLLPSLPEIPIAFRTIALLIVVMAMSIGVYDWQLQERCGVVLLANGFLARPE